jgi:hypothetical protein
MKFHYTGSKSELALSILYFLTLIGLLIYTGAQCGRKNGVLQPFTGQKQLQIK